MKQSDEILFQTSNHWIVALSHIGAYKRVSYENTEDEVWVEVDGEGHCLSTTAGIEFLKLKAVYHE